MKGENMNSGKDVFEAFASGCLRLPEKTIHFSAVEWKAHPSFAGVFLKHLVVSTDTAGRFSYHLVRIDPDKAIGDHVHATQLETHEVMAGSGAATGEGKRMAYAPGVVAVFEAGSRHSVEAGADGLLLFAKFMPALC